MSEKCSCGRYLAFCSSCKTIFCPRCDSDDCPDCGRHVSAGNVNEITHKIAKHDLS